MSTWRIDGEARTAESVPAWRAVHRNVRTVVEAGRALGIDVRIGIRLSTEPSLQSLGGQFCSHAATVSAATAATTRPEASRRSFVD